MYAELYCNIENFQDGIIYIFNGCRPLSAASAEAYDRI